MVEPGSLPEPAREPTDPPAAGIPEQAEGSPAPDADTGAVPPLADLPTAEFWDALYSRRSIRKFLTDPVPRELVDQVMHAGIWAPSSCNYQMWDLVAVDDPEINAQLASLSLQMSNAPVNIVVSYGRDFSEENWANIQSASAMIQNMSLAAQVLGLGTFWITQTGGAEKVRQVVGLPVDRMVIAVLALGYPKVVPEKGPRRRPLSQVTHYNHYAGRAIPSAVDPERWEPDLLATYQRARVLNGLRHNKPRVWEMRALTDCLDRLVPEGRKPEPGTDRTWLDVLPCTGILTERIARERRGFRFDVIERTPDVARFVSRRVKPNAGVYLWGDADGQSPPDASYDVVSCFYRLEDLASEERRSVMSAMARWVRPGGKVILGFVNKRSYHDLTERMRARRGGPGGVEYVLAPDPNIGPFESLSIAHVRDLARASGLQETGALGVQAVPQTDELEFRARNFSPRGRGLVRFAGKALRLLEHLPGAQARLGRFQFLRLEAGPRSS
ncbi:MAG: nitroreductase/SAM-dependent methyltransferase [Chlamydiales bacterium]|jgi:nitroreductase/SAM-dependent methyltransferase